MTGYNRGDVVLVGFVFSGESGTKNRPAVVVSSDDYNRGRNEAIIAAITSRKDRLLIGDFLIDKWQEAGLLFPSVATAILRTIKNTMISRKIGSMSSEDMQALDDRLKQVLSLS